MERAADLNLLHNPILVYCVFPIISHNWLPPPACPLLHNVFWSIFRRKWYLRWRLGPFVNTMTHWRLRWRLAFFSNEIYLMKVCALFFRHNAVINTLQYRVNVTFVCTGKPNKYVWLFCYSLYGSGLELKPHYRWGMPVLSFPRYLPCAQEIYML